MIEEAVGQIADEFLDSGGAIADWNEREFLQAFQAHLSLDEDTLTECRDIALAPHSGLL